MASPGVVACEDESVICIDRLDAGSALTIAFRLWPPDFWGNPRRGKKEAPYYTWGEAKSFVFNIFYSSQKSGQQARTSQTVSVNLRYTTSIGFYLLLGLVGFVLGHVVKTGTKDRNEITAGLGGEPSFQRKFSFVLRYIFVWRLSAFFTILAVGFGALLVLARDSIPITSWHQAIALGTGLAILTDEQLLAKIKSSAGQ